MSRVVRAAPNAMRLRDFLVRRRQMVMHYAGPDTPPEEVRTHDRSVSALLDLLSWSGVVCVDVTNVVDFLDDQDGPGLDLERLDGVRPPWPVCWLEGEIRDSGVTRTGILVVDGAFGDHPWVGSGALPPLRSGETLLVTTVWSWLRGESFPFGPDWMTEFVITADGRLRGDEVGATLASLPMVNDPEAIVQDYAEYLKSTSYLVPLATFQFANCRNVEIAEALPSRQERRRQEREHAPTVKHYVLEIGGEPRVKRPPTPRAEPRHERRLHICRGHFATYTDAAPLFGKLTGRFWVPAHVRGFREQGVVVKDYRVAPR